MTQNANYFFHEQRLHLQGVFLKKYKIFMCEKHGLIKTNTLF